MNHHCLGAVLALASLFLSITANSQNTLKQAVASKQVRVFGQQLRGDPQGVNFVEYSPDGKRVLTAGDGGELRLWYASSGKLKKTIVAHEGGVIRADYIDEGSKIVSVGRDRCVAVFDAKTGAELGRVRGLPERLAKEDAYLSAQPTSDGKYLLVQNPTRGAGNILRIDLQKFAMAEPLTMPQGDVTRFALSHDDRYLAFAERGEMFETFLHLYDLGEKKTVVRFKMEYPNAMCFSPDGSKLFVLDYKAWWVWNGRTGEKVASYRSLVDTPRRAAVSSDSGRLYVGSGMQGHVIGVDLAKPEVLFEWVEFATDVLGVALSPDQKTLAAGSGDGSLRFFDAKTGKEKKKPKVLQTRVSAVALSADGGQLLTGTYDNEVALWDVKRKKILSRHREHEFYLTHVGFNAKGQAWSVGEDMKLKLHGATGKVTKTVDLKSKDKNLMSVTPSPDGSVLVTSHYVETEDKVTGKQFVWSLVTGELMQTLETDEVFNAQCLSADGKKMAVVQGDRLAFWPVGGKEPGFVFEPQEDGYYGVALVGTDAAVTINLENQVVLWKRGLAAMIKAVDHGVGIVILDIAVSPDGQRIFLAGLDGIVVYDPELKELGRITAYQGLPVCLALSSDGKQLLGGMSDSTVLIWSLDKVLK